MIYPCLPGLRLTLTSGTAVTTSDVTSATTIFFTPLDHGMIWLYVNGRWRQHVTPQISLAVGTLASVKPHDVFCYSAAGVPTLELLIWTNDTSRATAISTQDGFPIKSGDATRLHIGTIYPTATTTLEDSAAKRYVWNRWNQRPRQMLRFETANSWTYSAASGTFQQANANTANCLQYVTGDAASYVECRVDVLAQTTAGTNDMALGIGLDSTTVTSGSVSPGQTTSVTTASLGVSCIYKGYPGLGRHALNWLESGTNGKYYGSNSGTTRNASGIHGTIWG